MKDNRFDLSRRKVLGTLGTIGAAGALGGAATSSLLWDEEVFGDGSDPNLLQAGALDLKVDYEEHYVDWVGTDQNPGPDGTTEADNEGVNVNHEAETFADEPISFEDQAARIDFFDETQTEKTGMIDQPTHDHGIRMNFDDIKPGDMGEVTFSYHVFHNPGFVELCATKLGDLDNPPNGSEDVPEPEDKENGHTPDNADSTSDGDLGDFVRARAWVDDGDNYLEEGDDVELMLAVDVSESFDGGFQAGVEMDDDTSTKKPIESLRNAVANGFIPDLETCDNEVEIGSVSFALDLFHLDDTSTSTTEGAGFRSNLDVGLHTSTGDPTRRSNLRSLYEDDADSEKDPDATVNPSFGWTTDDPSGATVYNPYVPDGTTTTENGIIKSHKGLLPSGYSGAGGETGIDPTGNADTPGPSAAEKKILLITDGHPPRGFQWNDPTSNPATDAARNAEKDGIEVNVILLNPSTDSDDEDFARAVDTNNTLRVASDGTELQTVLNAFATSTCGAGGEQLLCEGSLNDVISCLSNCQLLSAGVTGAAAEYPGTHCHAPSMDHFIGFEWFLPRDIPGVNDNIIQSDRFEFTLSFQAWQCRHNVDEQTGEPITGFEQADTA